MNIQTKKEMVKKFFQMMLDAAHQEENDHIDHLKNAKMQEFEQLKKQIIAHIDAEEIEGLINCSFDEIFSIDHPYMHVMAHMPDNGSLHYERAYLFVEDQNKLYYIEKNKQLEPISIKNIDRFKSKLKSVMGNERDKCLTHPDVNNLITTETGHIPLRLINQIEAKRIVSGSRDLIEAIHDQEREKTTWKALGLTLLTCVAIITIPFAGLIYNRLREHLYSKQAIQEDWSTSDVLTKLNNAPKESYKNPLTYMDTSTKEIYDVFHREEASTKQHTNPMKEPYIKKTDLFNKSGELRKLSVNTSLVMRDAKTAGAKNQSPILLTKEQRARMWAPSEVEKQISKKRSQEQIEHIVKLARNS